MMRGKEAREPAKGLKTLGQDVLKGHCCCHCACISSRVCVCVCSLHQRPQQKATAIKHNAKKYNKKRRV